MVTFLHTVLLSTNLKFRTALVVCPLNTILNWVNEFRKWQSDVGPDKVKVCTVIKMWCTNTCVCVYVVVLNAQIHCMLQVTELATVKHPSERLRALQGWQRDGGVMIIGYEMYRNLSLAKKVRDEAWKKEIKRILVAPGMVHL